jgi:general secretion pathway protein H
MIGRRKLSGFSLLELLVVVFIIGVLATMFTLSVGITGDDRDLQRETDRIEALLRLASEEATLQGREIGMTFFRDGYEFSTYFEDFEDYRDAEESDDVGRSKWTLIMGRDMFGPRGLPADMLIELEIDGRTVILDPREPDKRDKDDEREYKPQVLIFSSGEVTPFVLRLRRSFQNTGVILDVKDDGTIELTQGAT